MKIYLRPLSFLYQQAVGVKNALYDRGLLGSYKAAVPVMSIGNLTVGGTGKTPLTDFCLKSLVKEGRKVAVISRSYRAQAREPSRVDVTKEHAAAYYGDEPVLLAKSNPEVAVFVGPSKWQTARYACEQGKFDLLIVDDGFQHRKLYRDLNVVVLDATEALANYEVVPEGRAREPWTGLERADLILISKANWSSSEDLKELEEKVPPNKEILYFGSEITRFRQEGAGVTKTAQEMLGKKFFLVSAIARPDVFERMMREFGDVANNSLHYRDHHPYSPQDCERILDEYKKSQADFLVTTEKDAVKLQGLMSQKETLWTAALEIKEMGGKGRLHEMVSQTLR